MNPAENSARGRRGESIACDFLMREGYRILCRNYRAAHGEIDIIAEDDRYLVFVEVKARRRRSDARYGRPADAINTAKKQHITSAANQYLTEHPTMLQPRIDVIEVYTDESVGDGFVGATIQHFKNAFGAQK